MCDYSLMGVPNRLACEGEELVVCQFKTGSMGLTATGPALNPSGTEHIWGLARTILQFLGAEFVRLTKEPVAACIPPGARLMLQDIPNYVQAGCGVGAVEEVTFTQITATPYEYRDAVRFHNGQEVLLQDLEIGQRVSVLQLSLGELGEVGVQDIEPDEVVFPEHMPLDFVAPRSFGGLHRRRESRHE